jgi:uncharacterized protein involved in exopolysaccharide biosynthesis
MSGTFGSIDEQIRRANAMKLQLDAWEADLDKRERDFRFIDDELNEFADNLSLAEHNVNELVEQYGRFGAELDKLERLWSVPKGLSPRPRQAPQRADDAAITDLLSRIALVRKQEKSFLERERKPQQKIGKMPKP